MKKQTMQPKSNDNPQKGPDNDAAFEQLHELEVKAELIRAAIGLSSGSRGKEKSEHKGISKEDVRLFPKMAKKASWEIERRALAKLLVHPMLRGALESAGSDRKLTWHDFEEPQFTFSEIDALMDLVSSDAERIAMERLFLLLGLAISIN